MRKKTFRNAKITSLVLGFFYIGGYLWFSDYYLSNLSLFSLFAISPGLALVILPLISDVLLRYVVIRSVIALLGVIAILNTLYMMGNVLTYTHFIDTIADMLIHVVVLFVLIIILWRIINPKLEGEYGVNPDKSL